MADIRSPAPCSQHGHRAGLTKTDTRSNTAEPLKSTAPAQEGARKAAYARVTVLDTKSRKTGTKTRRNPGVRKPTLPPRFRWFGGHHERVVFYARGALPRAAGLP